MKDIAYGTRQYKLDTTKFEFSGDGGSALEESVELERGQNLLQFHISQVHVSCMCMCGFYKCMLLYSPAVLWEVAIKFC